MFSNTYKALAGRLLVKPNLMGFYESGTSAALQLQGLRMQHARREKKHESLKGLLEDKCRAQAMIEKALERCSPRLPGNINRSL